MTRALDAALDAVAVRQQQLLTREQVLAAGHTDMYVYRLIRRGAWQRVLNGIYCVTNGVLTDEQRRIAAALYAGPNAQLTGPTALAWYGFRTVPPSRQVHVVVGHDVRCRSHGFVAVRRALELDESARHTEFYRAPRSAARSAR